MKNVPVPAPRRILVQLPNWVGDVVMATPALAALRAAQPEAEIVAEGRPYLAGLVRGLPSLGGFRPAPRCTREHVRALRAGRFDYSDSLQSSMKTLNYNCTRLSSTIMYWENGATQPKRYLDSSMNADAE